MIFFYNNYLLYIRNMNNKDVQLKIKVYTGVVTGKHPDLYDEQYFTKIIVDTKYVGMCKKIWYHLKEYINEDTVSEMLDDLNGLNYKQHKDYIDKGNMLFKTYFEQENIPNNIETIHEIILYFLKYIL